MSRREGVGLIAGVAALALGGVAAGFKLEHDLVGRRLRALRRPSDEPFFGLRADGPVVETLDGVRLHVEVDELPVEDESSESDEFRSDGPARAGSGEGPAPTLVFVHGYALSLDCWHFQRKYFRGRYRMIFYDQRSHGRSGRSRADLCRIPQLADDLAQILHEVAGAGPIVLIGHSMGGMTIMELARQHPEWFGQTSVETQAPVDGRAPVEGRAPVDRVGPIIGVGLVCTSSDDLLDPHPVRGLPGRFASRLVEPTLAVLNRIPSVVEHTRRAGSDLAYLLTRGMSYPSPVPASYVEFLQEMLSQTSVEVIGDFLPAFAELDEAEGLAVINTVPAAVIGARQDLVTPFRHTERIVQQLPAAEKLILDPAGHMAMIEHHDRVDSTLDRLVRRAVKVADSGSGR